MIVVIKQGAEKEQVQGLIGWLTSMNLTVHISEGENQTILGLVSDTTQIDQDMILSMNIVEDVKRIQEPYKKANRKFHPEDTVVQAGSLKIGGGNFALIAGPCSVESSEQICGIAAAVKSSGASALRGGAFKPRTSPYSFQGMRAQGLELLKEAKKETGLPIVTEVMDISQLPLFEDVDVIQVGARNMQNFELLKEVGKLNKPVLLKRGMSATYEELLMSAEYIMAGGNEQVILCERGIRTFEHYTRNTLDLTAVPVLKQLTHLPVIVDPSHAIGISRFVYQMSLAAVAAGADGLIVEVHNNPSRALCDGPQSITPDDFARLAGSVEKVRRVMQDV